MAGFLGQIAQSAGAAAGAGGTGGGADLGSFVTSVASNFLQPFFDNYYQDRTTGNRAENYNKYADMTYPEDSRRMLNRMDTLYPGTTPWERLGIQPASSPTLPDSKAPGSAPFLLAQMQQDTALQTTKMNNDTAEKIALINTGQGEKPKQDIAESVSRQALMKAQGLLAEANVELTKQQGGLAYSSTVKNYNDISTATVAQLIALLPTTTINAGPVTMSQKDGWANVVQLLGTLQDGSTHERGQLVEKYFKGLPPDELAGMKKDALALARFLVDGIKNPATFSPLPNVTGGSGAISKGSEAIKKLFLQPGQPVR